mmetsp:Transcript_27954/g.82174  ORF Transcript_27954/g.82174 Transcript_27954/m.82174 type:complete len:223 (+) Transcript_27954:501-1169(+)
MERSTPSVHSVWHEGDRHRLPRAFPCTSSPRTTGAHTHPARLDGGSPRFPVIACLGMSARQPPMRALFGRRCWRSKMRMSEAARARIQWPFATPGRRCLLSTRLPAYPIRRASSNFGVGSSCVARAKALSRRSVFALGVSAAHAGCGATRRSVLPCRMASACAAAGRPPHVQPTSSPRALHAGRITTSGRTGSVRQLCWTLVRSRRPAAVLRSLPPPPPAGC